MKKTEKYIFTVFIVDDGSTDETVELLNEAIKK